MSTECNWPVELLASAVWPNHDPHGLSMAIFLGYFEAASPPGAPTMLTVSGCVSEKARWRQFESRWAAALRHEGLTAFNARNFSAGTGEFQKGWQDGERRRRLLQGSLRDRPPACPARVLMLTVHGRVPGNQLSVPVRGSREWPLRGMHWNRDQSRPALDRQEISRGSDALRLRGGRRESTRRPADSDGRRGRRRTAPAVLAETVARRMRTNATPAAVRSLRSPGGRERRRRPGSSATGILA